MLSRYRLDPIKEIELWLKYHWPFEEILLSFGIDLAADTQELCISVRCGSKHILIHLLSDLQGKFGKRQVPSSCGGWGHVDMCLFKCWAAMDKGKKIVCLSRASLGAMSSSWIRQGLINVLRKRLTTDTTEKMQRCSMIYNHDPKDIAISWLEFGKSTSRSYGLKKAGDEGSCSIDGWVRWNLEHAFAWKRKEKWKSDSYCGGQPWFSPSGPSRSAS